MQSRSSLAAMVLLVTSGAAACSAAAPGPLDEDTDSVAAAISQDDAQLDTSFNKTGLAVPFTTGGNTFSQYASAVTSDGKIWTAGGYFTATADVGYVGRVNADGTTDSTWGNALKVVGTNDLLYAMLAQGTRMVVAGYNYNVSTKVMTGVVMRLSQTTNALDTTFGTKGTASIAIPGHNGSQVDAIAAGTAGKIVVVGHAWNDNATKDLVMYALRLNANGTRDTSFAITTMAVSQLYGGPQAVVSVPPGKDDVWLAHTATGSGVNPFVAHVTAKGGLDTSFSGDGKLPFTGGILGLVGRVDGSLYVLGMPTTSAKAGVYHVRNGVVDTNFGNGGVATVVTPASFQYCPGCLAYSEGFGRIFIGATRDGSEPQFFAESYTADGQPDPSFGGDGKVIAAFPSSKEESLFTINVTSDRVVLTGLDPETKSPSIQTLIARYRINHGAAGQACNTGSKCTGDLTCTGEGVTGNRFFECVAPSTGSGSSSGSGGSGSSGSGSSSGSSSSNIGTDYDIYYLCTNGYPDTPGSSLVETKVTVCDQLQPDASLIAGDSDFTALLGGMASDAIQWSCSYEKMMQTSGPDSCDIWDFNNNPTIVQVVDTVPTDE